VTSHIDTTLLNPLPMIVVIGRIKARYFQRHCGDCFPVSVECELFRFLFQRLEDSTSLFPWGGIHNWFIHSNALSQEFTTCLLLPVALLLFIWSTAANEF